jgi:hypothetical protein
MEASGLAGPTLAVVLVPGLIAAGVGALTVGDPTAGSTRSPARPWASGR